MPTGFDKFKKKALEETPIKINKPSDFSGEQEENAQAGSREQETVDTSSRRPAAAQPEAASGRKTAAKKEKDRSLVNFMAQISPETKQKIDEMRFRLKMKNWEIVDEAVKDLYDKYFKR